MKHYGTSHFDVASPATALTTEDYVRLLHPSDAIGKTTLMIKDGTGERHSKTYGLAAAPVLADSLLDNDAYISLHRFHGPRKISNLAALNGLFLDLDVDRLPVGVSRNTQAWSLDVLMQLVKLRLPPPSILMSTGRGLAAIWLINPLPPQALLRWQPTQNALIDLFRKFGADPACRDAARVTRLPGSLNSKSGSLASIIDGSLARHDFDELADEIYRASGRPTRAQLNERKERKKKRATGNRSGGLSPRARFQAVTRDLERVRHFWGGQVPEGVRNIWLHLYATCLSHTSENLEVVSLVEHMAAVATPDLPRTEVAAIAKAASRHAALPTTKNPTMDGRYHYSGAAMAELLGVTAESARALGLEQIMPIEERSRRKAERERQRRREAGAVSRDAWLQANSTERRQPWVEHGISRSTYYRRRKTGQIIEPNTANRVDDDETGPCPLQGGSALPKAPSEGRGPSDKGPNPPIQATGPQAADGPARVDEGRNLPRFGLARSISARHSPMRCSAELKGADLDCRARQSDGRKKTGASVIELLGRLEITADPRPPEEHEGRSLGPDRLKLGIRAAQWHLDSLKISRASAALPPRAPLRNLF